MPMRTWSDPNAKYKYGFNGKELDKGDEGMGGGGSTYDYGFRIYNSNLGRFLSVDPLSKSYPWYTPYQFSGNKPILCIDLDGLEEQPATVIPAPPLTNVDPPLLNVLIVVLTAADISKFFTAWAPDGMIGDYYVIFSHDITLGAEKAASYLNGRKADNIVIDCHGLTTLVGKNEIPHSAICTSPTNSDPRGNGSIDSDDINSYMKKRFGPTTDGLENEKHKDIQALDKIMDMVAEKGNLIISGCTAGLDSRLAEKLIKLGEFRFNIFMNKDESDPRAKVEAIEKPKVGWTNVITSIDFSTSQGGVNEGWVLVNPVNLVTSLKDETHTGNIILSTDKANSTPTPQSR
jgi:RHS repeat-associated protein